MKVRHGNRSGFRIIAQLVVVVDVSHIQHVGCQPETLDVSVANIIRRAYTGFVDVLRVPKLFVIITPMICSCV